MKKITHKSVHDFLSNFDIEKGKDKLFTAEKYAVIVKAAKWFGDTFCNFINDRFVPMDSESQNNTHYMFEYPEASDIEFFAIFSPGEEAKQGK